MAHKNSRYVRTMNIHLYKLLERHPTIFDLQITKWALVGKYHARDVGRFTARQRRTLEAEYKEEDE
jgi:hypothetical protein